MDEFSVDQLLLAQRKCFVDKYGFMVCNFVIRNGCPILLQSGKNHRFKARHKKKTQQVSAESSVEQLKKVS